VTGSGCVVNQCSRGVGDPKSGVGGRGDPASNFSLFQHNINPINCRVVTHKQGNTKTPKQVKLQDPVTLKLHHAKTGKSLRIFEKIHQTEKCAKIITTW